MNRLLQTVLEPPLLLVGWASWTLRCRLAPWRQVEAHRDVACPFAWPLERTVAGKRPVVLGDAFDRWPALRQWTLEGLASRLGSVELDVLRNEGGEPAFLDSFFEQRTARLTLGELVNRLRQPNRKERYYLAGTGLSALGALLAELELPAQIAGRSLFPEGSGLWIGEAGNITDLHYDVWHGFLVQIAGRKQVTLFEPNQAALLYPESPFGPRRGWSSRIRDHLDRIDLGHFPAFARARPLRLVLDPGAALYIPPGFWHHVESLDTTVSLSMRYMPRWSEYLRPYTFPVLYGLRFKNRVDTLVCALRRRLMFNRADGVRGSGSSQSRRQG
jgi:cupin-like protein